MSTQTMPYFISSIKIKPYNPSKKTRHSTKQIQFMEACFQQNLKPNSQKRKEIASYLNLPLRAVQIWFQNRRAKLKSELKSQQLLVSSSTIEEEEEKEKEEKEKFILNRSDVISINSLLNDESEMVDDQELIQYYLEMNLAVSVYSSENFQ